MRMTIGIGAFAEDGVHGVDDFRAAAVVEGNVEDHAGIFSEGFGGFAGIALDGFGELIGAAEETHADFVFLEERHLLADVFAKKGHEEFDFGLGAAPVFDREGVESERFDVEASTGFDGGAGGLRAGAMTGDAREMTLLGPASVAVHDDGNVARKALEVEFCEETRLLGGDRTERFESRRMGTRVGH